MRTLARPAPWTVLLLLAVVLATGAPTAVGAPDGPPVTVRTLDLSRVEGRLVSMDATSLTLDASGTQRTFRLDEVIHLGFAATRAVPQKAPRFRAYLVGGERVVGRFVAPAEDGIALEVTGLGRIDVLFEHLLTLESMPPDAGLCHDVAGKHERPASGDVAIDTRKDEYAGTVLEATADALVLESKRGRKRPIRWSALRLAHLENEALKPAAGVHAEVELQDGSRLATAKLGLVDKGLRVTLRSMPDKAFAVPFEAVRSVRWKGGRFDYASDLPHTAVWKPYYADVPGVESQDYLRQGWLGPRVDRRKKTGCPLRLGGTTFRHGFGVNSHTTITIPLGATYATFRTTFGIDDEVLTVAPTPKDRGNVDARILADGKVLWEAKGVRAGEKPRSIGPLDVKGVKSLVLEVGFGKELFELDRADWCDPILVKAAHK